MKHLTFFICTLGSGGAEHQLSILANLLCDRGYKISIVTFGDLKDHYILNSKIDRIRIGEGSSSFIKAIKIFCYFLFVKTDYIISFTQRANALVLPALFFRPSLPIIVGERNCTIGPADNIEKILFSILYYRANWIVPNSYSQGRHIQESRPSLSSKIKVIINYTDLDEFQMTPMKELSRVKMGIFCRYDLQKNYIRFIEAIAKLKRSGYTDLEVHWYGASHILNEWNPDYLNFCKLVKDNSLETIVFAHESTKNVALEIAQYNVLCLPSLFEGFSNSLSEYICCGRPILASDVSDNSLMVHDNENGFLFDPKDIDSIIEAFKKYFSLSEDQRKQMGVRSREISKSLFDKDKFLESYISLIES